MNLVKLIGIVSLGGSIELYDFVIFASFSQQIGQTYFPNNNPNLEIVSVLILFAIGYLVRPIGGVFFSHFGDRIGRKKVFMNSILLMGVTTLAMSLTPSFSAVGWFGTITFVTLRIIQGLALGGEIPGAITYIVEHSKKSPGLACGLLFLFNNLGILVANLVHSLNLSSWRTAFFLGAVFSFLSFLLRKNLTETSVFQNIKDFYKIPIISVFKSHKRKVISGILVTSLGATIVSLLFISMVGYLKNFGNYNTGEITYLTTISMIAYLSCMALMGALSDFIGRVKFLTIGVVFLAIFIVPFYELINLHGNLLSMTVSFFVLGVISGVITGTFPSVIAGIFPTNIRYTGVAISFNIGFAFFGGLSPLFASMFNPIYLVWLSCILCFIGLKLISNESRIITFGKVV